MVHWQWFITMDILVLMSDPTKQTVDEWVATLETSEDQIAAGRSVPLEPILKRLHETADSLETKAAGTGRRRIATSSRR